MANVTSRHCTLHYRDTVHQYSTVQDVMLPSSLPMQTPVTTISQCQVRCNMWSEARPEIPDLSPVIIYDPSPPSQARQPLIGRAGASVTDSGWNMTDIRMICRTEMSHNLGSSSTLTHSPALHHLTSLLVSGWGGSENVMCLVFLKVNVTVKST